MRQMRHDARLAILKIEAMMTTVVCACCQGHGPFAINTFVHRKADGSKVPIVELSCSCRCRFLVEIEPVKDEPHESE